jgi:hypothetical protein
LTLCCNYATLITTNKARDDYLSLSRLKGTHLSKEYSNLNREAALRKVSLLRRVIPERGATRGEFESATHLAKKLADGLALPEDEIIRRTHEPNNRRSWVYWEQAVSEFGLRMNHFGSRANLRVGDALIVIDFERSQWTFRKSSPMGYREVMRKTGLDSFREFLQKHAPRRYSLGYA